MTALTPDSPLPPELFELLASLERLDPLGALDSLDPLELLDSREPLELDDDSSPADELEAAVSPPRDEVLVLPAPDDSPACERAALAPLVELAVVVDALRFGDAAFAELARALATCAALLAAAATNAGSWPDASCT